MTPMTPWQADRRRDAWLNPPDDDPTCPWCDSELDPSGWDTTCENPDCDYSFSNTP